MRTQTESFTARVLRLWLKNCQSITKAFAFNTNLGHMRTHATTGFVQLTCSIRAKAEQLRNSRMLLVTFNIATVVCDGRGERRRRGVRVREEFLVFYHDKWRLALSRR